MSRLRSSSTASLGLLVTGRFADSLTTLYGLSRAGVYERNPVVAAVIADLGPIAGIAVLNAAALLVVVAVTELGVVACRRQSADERALTTVRLVGYLPYAVVSFVAAAYNARLLLLL